MADKEPEPPKKPDDEDKVRVIHVASFENPRPFETRKGAFHPYTYIPFIGWLPPTELNLIIAALGIFLAIVLPHVGKALRNRAEVRDIRALSELRLSKVQVQKLPELDLRPWHGKTSSSSVGTESDDSGDWRYGSGAGAPGDIFINCTHTDLKGRVWSAY